MEKPNPITDLVQILVRIPNIEDFKAPPNKGDCYVNPIAIYSQNTIIPKNE